MKVMTKENIFDDFAWVLEINDLQLAMITEHPERINTDMPLMLQMMKAKANNAHILQLTLCGDINIASYIERLLVYYDSVSWVHEDKFYLRRRKLCHKSQQLLAQ